MIKFKEGTAKHLKLIFSYALTSLFIPLLALSQTITDCSSLVNFIEVNIGNTLQAIIGAVAVIMILFAAFKYLTAGDDAQKVKAAHATITWAVVGVAVAIMAYALITIVVSMLGGSLACP
ncbi:MAG: hypothetical protein A3G49_04540 [Candidatus Sungbacteria bacterium RIFCSPLOWO2_12_FULL_41_11]|uniref:Uncharacterized protein n=1 Tax=Candidatus Sungbacteria bacterium RIFCSPLOWO2_12_FULL_41_11 TaxID=1802286 RepID=A0A1G2LQF7_9BACT|nr:MAG: hypothetical protein UV01_C0018G0016 [Parcubacteria group bacterium GW2011_GWA2_42_14]OGZ97937.1 MAG: hypothetical protein A3D41_00375 [Candidatus Sungbacteria bacterium RIFCSPHIGHO2_02_FULL_41_12b]OHA13845.1 MAG: hypothetical protein A3G49_04540 [Candidatus Sungbacteria bacterium RIFCSPLOWO2_12_FULL_41_11]